MYKQALLPLLFISYYKQLCLGAVKVLTQSSGGKNLLAVPLSTVVFLYFSNSSPKLQAAIAV